MILLWLLVALAGPATATATTAAAEAQAGQPGTWQTHQLQFYYLGSSAAYTCAGLEAALRDLLEQSGAQQITVSFDVFAPDDALIREPPSSWPWRRSR